jgi:hypothetical protein
MVDKGAIDIRLKVPLRGIWGLWKTVTRMNKNNNRKAKIE